MSTHRIEKLYPWAGEMGAVIQRVSSSIDLGIGGMGSSDGAWTSERKGLRIRDALVAAGHKLLVESSAGWQIAHKEDERVGAAGDFDDEAEGPKFGLWWFNEIPENERGAA